MTLSPQELTDIKLLARDDPRMAAWLEHWIEWRTVKARPEQICRIDTDANIRGHCFVAGRGWGKTRTGAEETFAYAMLKPGSIQRIITPTFADGRDVACEGESGIISISPDGTGSASCITKWNRSIGEVEFYNGSSIKVFSAEEPERLRGSQAHRDWMDELAAWGASSSEGDQARKNTARLQKQVWSMAAFGRRLPPHATFIITTTPKPTPLVKEILSRKDVFISRGSTYDNIKNLDEEFRNEILQYEGTLLGRQEIHAELLNLDGETIFKQEWMKLWPAGEKFPIFEFVVMSYDTAFTEKETGNYSACTLWGIFREKTRGDYCMMLIDCWRDRLGYPELRKRVIKDWDTAYGAAPEEVAERMRRFGREANGRRPDVLLIEEKASGQSLIQDLRTTGINVWAGKPGREDKIARAHAVSPLVASGRMYVPESLNPDKKGQPIGWAEGFVEEFFNFPNSEYADWSDSTTQALKMLRDSSWLQMDKRIETDDDLEATLGGAYNKPPSNYYAQ